MNEHMTGRHDHPTHGPPSLAHDLTINTLMLVEKGQARVGKLPLEGRKGKSCTGSRTLRIMAWKERGYRKDVLDRLAPMLRARIGSFKRYVGGAGRVYAQACISATAPKMNINNRRALIDRL
ncbi:hypothetical protein Pst134EB_016939 [Puccinia striiformis f. sp. tritici]|nr:hypothetical protein Pst134EB_016939 [Puccinia striiformis f. sp. tritici]